MSFAEVLEDLITVESRGLEPTETRVCKGEKSWRGNLGGVIIAYCPSYFVLVSIRSTKVRSRCPQLPPSARPTRAPPVHEVIVTGKSQPTPESCFSPQPPRIRSRHSRAGKVGRKGVPARTARTSGPEIGRVRTNHSDPTQDPLNTPSFRRVLFP